MAAPTKNPVTTHSGKAAVPLALAAFPEQDPRCVDRAFEGGINFFFFYGPAPGPFGEALRALLRRAKRRDDMIVASGSGSRRRPGLLGARRKILDGLGIDRLDVFFAEYVSPHDDPGTIFDAGGVLDELHDWKAQGVIRYVGATAHDRALATRLASDPRVDVLMHRFNMAHRKAERNVFPAARSAKTPVVAFTATRWRTLLAAPPGWSGRPATAADCYRYCLVHPAVALVLTAPQTVEELAENLAVLASPRMDDREKTHWERYGDCVYGSGADAFETKWA